jgi:hypothetical protein
MPHAHMIRNKLAEALAHLGYECDRDDSRLVIMKWKLAIEVVEGDEKNTPGGVGIFPTIYVIHRLFPGGSARELGVGTGPTLEHAVNDVSANWMFLFFPPLKFLFDEHPHDCTVHEEPLPALGKDDYRLIAGALFMRGFDGKQPEGISQSLMWNAFADLAPARIEHGVHHIRCFAGKFGGEISADVFLDGMKWEEASERLTELACTFPEINEQSPIHSLKQHLILRPADLQASNERDENNRLSSWLEALTEKIPPQHQELTMPVLRALYAMSKGGANCDNEDLLVSQGVDRPRAEKLVSFLQSAAARVIIGNKIQFSDTYYWANSRTHRAVLRRYDETPEFAAGVAIFGVLCQARVAQHEISAIASASAEMSGFQQAVENGTDLQGAKITSMVHHTVAPIEGDDVENLDEVMANFHKPKSPPPPPASRPSRPIPPTPRRVAPPQNKPWWKFW